MLMTECKNNNNLSLDEVESNLYESLMEQIKGFCETCKINIGMANYHLKNKAFCVMCKEKYYNE